MNRPPLNIAWKAAVTVGMDRELCGETRSPARGWLAGALEYGQTWARVVKARQLAGRVFP